VRVLYALAELDAQKQDAASMREYGSGCAMPRVVAPANLAVRLKFAEAFSARRSGQRL
jgi:hypothetical protein